MLARFGIRGFKPTLQHADKQIASLSTAEGTPLPKNTRAELCRDIARLHVIRDQIGEIEQERSDQLKRAPEDRTHG